MRIMMQLMSHDERLVAAARPCTAHVERARCLFGRADVIQVCFFYAAADCVMSCVSCVHWCASAACVAAPPSVDTTKLITINHIHSQSHMIIHYDSSACSILGVYPFAFLGFFLAPVLVVGRIDTQETTK